MKITKNILPILLIFLFLFGCKLFNRNGNGSANSNNPPSKTTSGSDTVQFVNSRANLTGKLAENYVDFSFDYPKSWSIDPATQKPGASNFTKVEKESDNFTMENFAVGYFSGSGSPAGDQALFPQLADQLSSQFSKGFPNYQKVSEGRARIGAYDAYEFRFSAELKNTPKGNLPIWGRVALIPNAAGKKNGVVLIMLATPLAPDVKSVNDVGVKGELPVIINSFKLN
jgi:hypothetical protein